MNLKFALTSGFFTRTGELSAPFDFTKDCGRLYDWGVLDGENRVWNWGTGVSSRVPGVTEYQRFSSASLKGLSLCLIVLEPVETVSFDFHFQNVPLP
jgi:hypothetical protein